MISQDHLPQLMIKHKRFRRYVPLTDNIAKEVLGPHQNHRKLAMTQPTSCAIGFYSRTYVYQCVFQYSYFIITIYLSHNHKSVLE